MDYLSLINKYYPADDALRRLLLDHSQSVMRKALQIVSSHPEFNADAAFVEEAAMLHDIGVFRCDAPGIYCHGTEPYIRHGVIGAEILRAEGFPRHARVCERHTGAGISQEEVVSQHLPLQLRSYLPETIEEQIICYADKFFSKSRPEREKTYEQALHSLRKFGDAGVERFSEWHEKFKKV
ncbi:MAG: HDIG domain-containing protein [Prevotella sp.]|nr:HDIG domain-containing protein [Prevotella sp.]